MTLANMTLSTRGGPTGSTRRMRWSVRTTIVILLLSLVSAGGGSDIITAAAQQENVTISRLSHSTLSDATASTALRNETSAHSDHEEDAEEYTDTDTDPDHNHGSEEDGDDKSSGSSSSGFLIDELMERDRVRDVGEALLRLQTTLETTVSRIFKELFPIVIRAGLELNISSSCIASYTRVYQGLRETKNWAFQMVDASGKPPSGVLTGTLTDLGSFDQCLAINHMPEDGSEGTVGQYCLMDLRGAIDANLDSRTPPPGIHADGVVWDRVMQQFWRSNDLLSFRYGLCVPSQCSADDIAQFVNFMAMTSGLEGTIDYCQTADTIRFRPDPTQIAIISGLSILLACCLIGTLLDCLPSGLRKYRLLETLHYFSLYSNTLRLFGTAGPVKPTAAVDAPDLQCLNGLRFFSVCWVIIGHTYYYTDFILYHHYRNLVEITSIDDPVWFTPIANFTLSVDTFFYISGLLLTYTTWSKLPLRRGRVDPLDFFLHRIWRIWPTYGVVIALAIILPLLSTGPLWLESVHHQSDNCCASWLYNLLFINNFQLADQLCLLHTWYLSANMQFHLVSALFLFAIYRSRTLGLLFCALGILLLALGTFWHAWSWNVVAPTIIPEQVFTDYSQTIMGLYMKPYTHGGAYLVGLMGGWTLINYKKLPIGFKTNIALWLMAGVLALLVIVSPHEAFAGNFPSVAVSALYWASHRVIWALFIGWLVHACATGRGGIVNHFLSWSAFQSLGNLSYLAYLVHPLLMMLHTGVARERVNFGHYELIQTFLSRTLTSFFLAYVLHVSVELPFAHLGKLIFPSRRKASPPPTLVHNISGPSSVRSTSTESIERETNSDSGGETLSVEDKGITPLAVHVLSSNSLKSSPMTFPLNSIFRGKLTGSYSVQ